VNDGKGEIVNTLRILIVEDQPADAELLEYEIRKGGFEFIATRVENQEGFLAALEQFLPDIIISDYHLPSFNGMQALTLAREHSPLTPFIIATGAMNEEIAVDCMKAGADDYVLKEHLKRLVPAISIALANTNERKHKLLAEESLLSSERKFRTIFENANDAILLLEGTLIVDCNPMAERIFGCPREALVGRPTYDFSPAFQKDGTFSRDLATEKIRKTIEGTSQYFEWRHHNSDGTPFDVDIGLSPVNIDGKPLVMAILRDITEKKRSELELRESEEKFKRLSQEFNALLDAIPDTILLQSRDMEIIWANRAAIANFGDSVEENGDRHCYRLVHGTSTPYENCPVLQSLRTGVPAKSILPIRDDMIWEVRAIPVRDDNGDMVSVIEIGRDVTELKKLEQQLIHAQKMEAVAQLSGGIAHDFNNIVTALIGYGNLLLMQLPEDSPSRHFAEQILVTSERAAELTRKILAFGRKKVFNLEALDISLLISGLRNFLERIIGEEVEIQTDLSTENLIVAADGSQIEQVLMNLATNARDAMPQGGLLSISTSRSELDTHFIDTHGYGEEGAYACIAVTDTGTGMDDATVKKIYEPFYTTKEPGKGTGLGLSIVYGIIKEHRGFISVDSVPGAGTSFRIYLPLIQVERQAPEIYEIPPHSGGTETILIAEDEDVVRKSTASFLAGFGYQVMEAVNGAEVLEIFSAFKGEIDLLILDVVMPDKGGREVAEAARLIRPDIRVLFNSGYPLDLLQYKGMLGEGVRFFTKPIDPRELLRKVREALDDEKQRR
jgi:PAS domain S-box-containing protein